MSISKSYAEFGLLKSKWNWLLKVEQNFSFQQIKRENVL